MFLKMGCAAGALLLAQVSAAQASLPATGGAAWSAIPAATVAAALAEAGLPVAESRLHLPGVLTARNPAPQLKIAAAEQRANGSLEVRFTCRDSVECMPFFVAVDAADDRTVLAGFAAHVLRDHATPTRVSVSGIAIGARVMLQLTDAQMRIQMPVVAIDTGAPGAEVRVASLDRKNTWRGVVVDATTVRGGVQ